MRHHWLNRAANDKLIMFFGGWSFDHKPFGFLDCEDYDVVMFYDYTDLSTPDIPAYKHVYLVTWSMGVFIAYLLKNQLPQFERKIAINGTPFPVDDNYGIPQKVFDLTLTHARTGLEGKFYRNVMGENFERYLLSPVARSIENRVKELHAISRHAELVSASQGLHDNATLWETRHFARNQKISAKVVKRVQGDVCEPFYDFAIIGRQDKIVPAKNQINFWQGRVPYKLLETGHFPFYNYTNWNEILRSEMLCR